MVQRGPATYNSAATTPLTPVSSMDQELRDHCQSILDRIVRLRDSL
jgi:hypothetical protein